MNKIIFISFILVGCGDGFSEETVTLHEQPTCWTVDGDPEVYQYIPNGMNMDEETQLFCENLKEVAIERAYK